MSNFFIAILLIILGLIPTTQKSEILEERLINKINENKAGSIQEIKITQIPEELPTRKSVNTRSEAIYFTDLRSGKVLINKNENQKLAPASITKLMTALIIVSESDIDEIITITPQRTYQNDSTMGLIMGDKIKSRELLHGLLINSGSDAAMNLAVNFAGNEEQFVFLMNQKAKQLGLTKTNFTNPVGWDDSNNYSSAKDLYILAKVALTNKEIASIVNKNYHLARSENGNSYYLKNTNLLLNNSGYKGIKTGTTFQAGECLASYYKDDNKEIMGVLLNSPSRFQETFEIIEWTKGSFLW